MAHTKTPYAGLYKPDSMSDGIDPQKMYVDNILQHETNYVGIIKMMKGSVGSIVELKAIDTSDTTKYVDGTMILLRGVGVYYFDSVLSAGDDTYIVAPTNNRGRWVLTNPDNVLQKAGGSDVAITINTSLVDGRTASFISQFSSNSTTKTINGKPWRIPGDTVSPRTISGYAYTVWYDANADCFFLKSTDKNIIIGTIATYGGWSGASAPYTNTITVSSVSAGDNILVSIGAGATAAEYAAAVDAQLHCSAQADSSVTITAFGTKPTIDIPITIVILH